jgi:hypothetical protein
MQIVTFCVAVLLAFMVFAVQGLSTFTADVDPISAIANAVVRDPTVSSTIAFMTFGALVKSLNYKYANPIGNILVSWYPSLIWTMVFVGSISVPSDLLNIFPDFTFFGWFLYLMLVGLIFLIISAVVSLFTGLTEKISIAF